MIEHEVGVAAALAVAVDRPLDVIGPLRTAASELATAHSASLCAWMPSGASTCCLTSRMISATRS